jgi:hypothetical protein
LDLRDSLEDLGFGDRSLIFWNELIVLRRSHSRGFYQTVRRESSRKGWVVIQRERTGTLRRWFAGKPGFVSCSRWRLRLVVLRQHRGGKRYASPTIRREAIHIIVVSIS